VKYVLISRHTKEVVWRTDIASDVGISGARTYFIGVKQTGPEEFDKLWEVMTESNYNSERLQSNPGYIKWWEEDKEITDSELKNGRGS
jgi:hypothetical protein